MPAVPIIAAVTGAATAVGTTVAAAVGLGTVSTVAATAIGSGLIAGATTAVMGGDASDVLESAVLGGVTSYVGGTVAPSVASAVTEATGSAIAGGVAGNVAATALTGGDAEDILASGLLGGIGAAVNQAKLDAADEFLQGIPSDGYNPATAPTELDILDVIASESPDFIPSSTTFTPDYSLSSTPPMVSDMGAQGVQSGGGLGMTIPGDVILGDETSFINQPAPSFNVVIPEVQQTPMTQAELDRKLAVADVVKAISGPAVSALLANENIVPDQQMAGSGIVPIPSDWRSPQYNMAFTPSAPIDFGTRELLIGTQWENPMTLSNLMNTLNSQQYQMPVVDMPDILQQFNVAPTIGVTDTIGNLNGNPVSIADIISGIQSGQNYSS